MEGDRHFARLRRLADDLDELDGLSGDEEIAVALAFDGLRVKDVAVRRDRDVLAELEEDPAFALVALVGTGGHENRLEGLEARAGNGMTIGKQRAYCGKLCGVVA